MIRPFTVICMVLAGASGLYLYQSKHRAQMLDREIARTLHQADIARERIGMLRAEWALLNEPDRLNELARAHTSLRTLQPSQFAALADLAAKLPAPAPPGTLPAVPDEPEETPVAAAAPPAGPAPTPTVVAQAAPPAPKPVQVARPAPVQAEARPEPRPAQAETRPAAAETRTAQAEPRPAAPRPAARPAPVQVVAAAPVPHPSGAPSPALNTAAVAPGTIGESVLRAMRATAAGPTPRPTFVQASAPVSAYPAPSYAAPSYAAPSYPAPSYSAQSYAAPAATSLLGGAHGALPPPVPYAVR